jgi:hypothetical protein
MEEFENLTPIKLRGMLAEIIIEVYGKNYALGWLQSAYTFGNRFIDEDRDYLIDQIREYRARKEQTLTV